MSKPKIKFKLKQSDNKDHMITEKIDHNTHMITQKVDQTNHMVIKYPPKKMIKLKLLSNTPKLPTIIKIAHDKNLDEDNGLVVGKHEQIYHIIKCPLQSVLKKYDILQPIIEETVCEMNQIAILGYQFIKLFMLDVYDRFPHRELPVINKQWILDILKTICNKISQTGRKVKKIRIQQLEEFQKFYVSKFSKLTHIERPSYTHKSHLIDSLSEQMLTCIENNLKTNFIKYLSKYINCLFRKPKAKIIHQIKDVQQRKNEYRQLNKEIRDLKTDLINGTIEHSTPEYHTWIRNNIHLLCPSEIIENIAYDVKCHPFKYLKHAIYINKQIELLNERPYQVFPQRKTMIPRHITLDTTNMIDIINHNAVFAYTKKEMYAHVQKYQPHVWGQILKLEKKNIFQQKKYSFHYQIKTDGWSCGLLFILNQYKGKKYTTKIPKNILSTVADTNRFKVLEDLTEEECNLYQSEIYKKIGNDPGKRHITTTTDNNGTIFQYSACQRRQENYTKRSSQILHQEKKQNGINLIESILTGIGTSDQTQQPKHKHHGRHCRHQSVVQSTGKPVFLALRLHVT